MVRFHIRTRGSNSDVKDSDLVSTGRGLGLGLELGMSGTWTRTGWTRLQHMSNTLVHYMKQAYFQVFSGRVGINLVIISPSRDNHADILYMEVSIGVKMSTFSEEIWGMNYTVDHKMFLQYNILILIE